jgi:hypothetical protein
MKTGATVSAVRQRGTVMILYALTLVLILGFAGLVVDLGMAYARMARLQMVADQIAIAAAMSLDGTAAGVTAATTAAAARWTTRWRTTTYWYPDALRFSDDPNAADGAWLTASAAAAAPARMVYTRVDTRLLADRVRQVQPVLMSALGITTPIDVRPSAVAGRSRLRVLPLAICTMGPESATRGSGASAELVNYGFRSGVTYNLLMLNTTGAPAGEYFYVNPLAPGDGTGAPAALTDNNIAPFMCSGTLNYPRVVGAKVHVRRVDAFNLSNQLNSRFEEYFGANPCNVVDAPPDTNVKNYVNTGVSAWQGPAVSHASALSKVVNGKLATIAELWPAQTYAPAEYGTRWAYGPAKNADGTKKLMSSWATLYPSSPAATYVQTASPYRSSLQAPADITKAQVYRRVLYVPLLQCPVSAGQYAQATVLAYGRFFLTAKASASEVPAEFAGAIGLDSEARLAEGAEILR